MLFRSVTRGDATLVVPVTVAPCTAPVAVSDPVAILVNVGAVLAATTSAPLYNSRPPELVTTVISRTAMGVNAIEPLPLNVARLTGVDVWMLTAPWILPGLILTPVPRVLLPEMLNVLVNELSTVKLDAKLTAPVLRTRSLGTPPASWNTVSLADAERSVKLEPDGDSTRGVVTDVVPTSVAPCTAPVAVSEPVATLVNVGVALTVATSVAP